MMQLAFFIACGLLLVGFVLRANLHVLGKLFVPASVVGGFVGFALLQVALNLHDARLDFVTEFAGSLAKEWRSWPGWLIAVVFAGMLLEKPATTFRQSLRRAASEGVVVWIIIVGQIALGFAVTWLILRPMFGTALPFGQLLEVSWAGGFGSSTAWGNIYQHLKKFPEAQDLAIFFAAMGLLYGTVSGIVLVNIAARRGWTSNRDTVIPTVQATHEKLGKLEYGRARDPSSVDYRPAAHARVPAEMIDPLVFQALILAGAFVMGWFLSFGVNRAAMGIDRILHRDLLLPFLGQLPLFLYTLLGGLIVREILYALRVGHLIDPLSIRRFVGAAMEFLIVAALASMNLARLRQYAIPAILLMLVGAIWCALTLIWLSRRLLPRDYWFELGIINYGMATATTAQGMMLLRMIDPDLKTRAAEDYALAAPLSAPFIGGGVVTMVLPGVMEHVSAGWVVVTSVALVVVLYLVGLQLRGKQLNAGDPAVRGPLTTGVEES
jgi:ESS family glutamate:Na+ symporter